MEQSMNYKWHYDNLIKTRKILNRKKGDGIYYEKHHIVMRSMGGTNSKNNLVLLTAKEHYIAHLLLWKIHRNSQTAYALHRFNICKSYKKMTGRLYEELQITTAKCSSDNFKKLWENPEMRIKLSKANSIKNKGRKHSKESIKNISEGHKGIAQTQEAIEKARQKNTGRKRTQETINKLIIARSKRRPLSKKARKNMSNGAKSRKPMDPKIRKEMIRKMQLDKRKPRCQYELISPNNQKHLLNGREEVYEFVKQNNLSKNILLNFLNKGKVILPNANTTLVKNSIGWELKTIKRWGRIL